MVADGHATEFLRDQFRHCKTILAIGDGRELLKAAGIPQDIWNNNGSIVPEHIDENIMKQFNEGLASHSHFARESDPPVI